jgi:hypothetical protein
MPQLALGKISVNLLVIWSTIWLLPEAVAVEATWVVAVAVVDY